MHDLTLINKPHPMSRVQSYQNEEFYPLNEIQRIRPSKFEQEKLLHQYDPYSLEEHRYLQRLQNSELRLN